MEMERRSELCAHCDEYAPCDRFFRRNESYAIIVNGLMRYAFRVPSHSLLGLIAQELRRPARPIPTHCLCIIMMKCKTAC